MLYRHWNANLTGVIYSTYVFPFTKVSFRVTYPIGSRGELLATPFKGDIPTGDRTRALRHMRLRCWNVRRELMHSASTLQIWKNEQIH